MGKTERQTQPYMIVLLIVLVAAAAFFIYRAMQSSGGPQADIEAMMPVTGQQPEVKPEEMAGMPKGVLPGGKH